MSTWKYICNNDMKDILGIRPGIRGGNGNKLANGADQTVELEQSIIHSRGCERVSLDLEKF